MSRPSITVVVVDRAEDWPAPVPGTELTTAREYLADPAWADRRHVRVLNCCRAYRYQGIGYYVSLLAEARGHRPVPTVATLQDLRDVGLARAATEGLEGTLERHLGAEEGTAVTMRVAFGWSLDGRHPRLAARLFRQLPVPVIEARFEREPDDREWWLALLRPLPVHELTPHERAALPGLLAAHLAAPGRAAHRQRPAAFYLAILVDRDEGNPPSDATALARFVAAAEDLGFRAELIERDDYGRLPTFDALFIRATTAVGHYTWRFARRAAAEGLPVIDDALSIARCSNKVYLAELLRRHKIPTPGSVVVHRGNVDQVAARVGLPCVLKLPDGAFSQAVHKVATPDALAAACQRLFPRSELLLAQSFVPTPFDWRIGVLDGEPLFACRYHMAPGHWQVIEWESGGRKVDEGTVDTLPVTEAPPAVVDVAVRASRLIGDGLYGVDCKEVDGTAVVIEVNDNPNIESDSEDRVLGLELYRRVVGSLRARIERTRHVRSQP